MTLALGVIMTLALGVIMTLAVAFEARGVSHLKQEVFLAGHLSPCGCPFPQGLQGFKVFTCFGGFLSACLRPFLGFCRWSLTVSL